MNRTLLALAATALLGLAPAAAEKTASGQGPTLEDVLKGHYEAIGGLEAWRSVSSARMVGRMSGPRGFEAPFTLTFKAPDKSRLEFVFQGMTGVQAVSGGNAWHIMPFLGMKGAEPMPEEQARLMIEQADFDGPLVNWEEDGDTLEYLGTEKVEGAEAHKVKVTLDTGEVRYYFLGADDFLPIKSSGKVTIEGQEQEIEIAYGDYKQVGDLVLAHSIESKPAGAPAGSGQTFTVDETELNVELPDEQFSMPSKGR